MPIKPSFSLRKLARFSQPFHFLGLLSLLLGLAACGNSKPAPINAQIPATKVSANVYVLYGPNETPNPKNQGFVNNPGFVLTKTGVVVIDPGASLQVGEMLLKKIAEITPKPVVAVFNTHIHGDHWLANGAIKRAYPRAVIYAHPQMLAHAASAGAAELARINDLTDDAAKDTKPVLPDLGLETSDTLALGGTHFRVLHSAYAHTAGDLMVQVVEENVLFLGDVVLAEHLETSPDTVLADTLAATDAALKTEAKYFVPGHGAGGGQEVVTRYRDFLHAVLAAAEKQRAAGYLAAALKDKVVSDLRAYHGWTGFHAEIDNFIYLTQPPL